MDEILIEEKKYVSSKRAAEMTGYAKDYIGQLCREGRVPARLIGRSWYVLESAIQDHRFGNEDYQPEKIVEPKSLEPEETTSWESPRYEASLGDRIPPIKTVKNEEPEIDISTDEQGEGHQEASQHIQDSWKEWFDRFDSVQVIEKPQIVEVEIEDTPERKEEEKEEDTKVNVPIHAVYRARYQPPPGDLLPHNLPITIVPDVVFEEEKSEGINTNKVLLMTIQMTGAVLCAILIIVTVIGSGYLDKFTASNGYFRMVSGVIMYNR